MDAPNPMNEFTSPTFWVGTAALIAQVISLFPRNKEQRTKDQEEALIALTDAYTHTERYYEYMKTNKNSRDKEWELAEKWDKAGRLLAKYDDDLAQRLNLKSRFWQSGQAWTKQQIESANIGLHNIRLDVELRVKQV